jgi:hypothetical protein
MFSSRGSGPSCFSSTKDVSEPSWWQFIYLEPINLNFHLSRCFSSSNELSSFFPLPFRLLTLFLIPLGALIFRCDSSILSNLSLSSCLMLMNVFRFLYVWIRFVLLMLAASQIIYPLLRNCILAVLHLTQLTGQFKYLDLLLLERAIE